MFGVTTPCVTAARKALEAAGHEVLVFHRRARVGEPWRASSKTATSPESST